MTTERQEIYHRALHILRDRHKDEFDQIRKDLHFKSNLEFYENADDLRKRIVDFVRTHPGATNRDISKQFGKATNAINHHTNKLVSDGKLVVQSTVKVGRYPTNRYEAATNEREGSSKILNESQD